MQALLSLSVALFSGLMLSRLAKLAKLPAVTAYLVAGILIGPYVLGAFNVSGLGFTSMADIKSYSIICDVALGFIAFSKLFISKNPSLSNIFHCPRILELVSS